MNQYIYSFRTEAARGETFFRFEKFPEIISSMPTAEFRKLSSEERQAYAADAVITALQTRIAGRKDVPGGDRGAAAKRDLYVALAVRQAMKLELYKSYLASDATSIAELARRLGKAETLVRRLLDLRHPSSAQEIEDVIGLLGKRLVHVWSLVDQLDRPRPSQRRARGHSTFRQAAE